MERYGITCPKCGYAIKAGAAVCTNCGYRIPLNEAAEWEIEREMMEYIEKNVSHYHVALQKQKEGKKIGWNWSAFLLGGVWAIYRKMNKVGLLLLAAQIVVGFVLTATVLFVSLPELREVVKQQDTANSYVSATTSVSTWQLSSATVTFYIDEYGNAFLVDEYGNTYRSGDVASGYYTDSYGNRIYIDEHGVFYYSYESAGSGYDAPSSGNGNSFYIDEYGNSFFVDEYGDSYRSGDVAGGYYTDSYGNRIYIDEHGAFYYLDKSAGGGYFPGYDDPYSGNESSAYTDGNQGGGYFGGSYGNGLQIDELFPEKTPLQRAEEALNRNVMMGTFWVFVVMLLFRIVVAMFADDWYLSFVRQKVEITRRYSPNPELVLSMEDPCSVGFGILSYVVTGIVQSIASSMLAVVFVIIFLRF